MTAHRLLWKYFQEYKSSGVFLLNNVTHQVNEVKEERKRSREREGLHATCDAATLDQLRSLWTFAPWVGMGIVLYYEYFHKLEKETGISEKMDHRKFVKSCSKVISSHRIHN